MRVLMLGFGWVLLVVEWEDLVIFSVGVKHGRGWSDPHDACF